MSGFGNADASGFSTGDAGATEKATVSTLDKIIPLSKLKDSTDFLDVIESIHGSKCLVMQSELRGVVHKLVDDGTAALQSRGVRYFLELSESTSIGFDGSPAPEKIIFLVRPNLVSMNCIARYIHEYAKGENLQGVYHVLFVPHSTVACEQVLEDEGVLDRCEIGEVSMGFAPLDSDLLTLGMGNVFRECYVDGDATSLSVVAAALHQLQAQFGTIPHVKSKGAASRKVLQKMLHLRRRERSLEESSGGGERDRAASAAYNNNSSSSSSSSSSFIRPEVDTMFVLDREIDLVSPLLSPLTYEGLVDDLLGMRNGAVLVSEALLDNGNGTNGEGKNTDDPPAAAAATSTNNAAEEGGLLDDAVFGTVKVTTDNTDSIFAEIRNLSIQRLGPFLQERAVENKQRHAAFRENKDASISELHDFVKKMPALTKEYKSLTQHIHIAELIKNTTDSREFREQWQGERGMLEGESFLDAIEEMITADADGEHLFKVLRLLCVQSITAGGIRSTRFDAIKRMVVLSYGYEHMFTLVNLERAGLLKRKDLILVDTTQPVWQSLRKQLKLIDDREDSALGVENDMSYVSAGYAPLSARLVQHVVTLRPAGMSQPSWRSVVEATRLLPGPTLEFTQASIPDGLDEALQRSAMAQQAVASQNSSSGSRSGGGGARDMGGVRDSNVEDELLMQHQLSLGMGSEGGELGQKKVMLVMIIGGLSFLEVAAFRVLSNDPTFPFRIVLASTCISSGDVFLRSMKNV